jgi:hypothetical protein
MRIRVTFIIYQYGKFREETTADYDYDDPLDGLRAMASLVNNNAFASAPEGKQLVRLDDFFQPPPARHGYGPTSVLYVKSIEPM